MTQIEHYLGIDFGEARIGLAMANSIAKLPSPYAIVPNNSDIFAKLKSVISTEKIDKLVVGLPRDMNGQETEQSRRTRKFADDLAKHTGKPIFFADESLSSIRAENNKPKKSGVKHQDDIAACYILEEFLKDNL